MGAAFPGQALKVSRDSVLSTSQDLVLSTPRDSELSTFKALVVTTASDLVLSACEDLVVTAARDSVLSTSALQKHKERGGSCQDVRQVTEGCSGGWGAWVFQLGAPGSPGRDVSKGRSCRSGCLQLHLSFQGLVLSAQRPGAACPPTLNQPQSVLHPSAGHQGSLGPGRGVPGCRSRLWKGQGGPGQR